jgi:hypothetical protein
MGELRRRRAKDQDALHGCMVTTIHDGYRNMKERIYEKTKANTL